MKFLIGLLILVGCSTTQETRELTPEQVAQQERALGEHVQKDLEQTIQIIRDLETSVYLRNLAEKIAAVDPKLKEMPVGVFLFRSNVYPWMGYAIPRGRVYLSVDLLKEIQNESELVALIGIQLVHLREKHLQERYSQLSQSDSLVEKKWVAPLVLRQGLGIPVRELFLFDKKQEVETIQGSVELVYQSGFDPRSVVEVWKHIERKSKGMEGAASRQQMEDLIEWSYEAVSRFAPLRNPIVKTAQFTKFQRRISKL